MPVLMWLIIIVIAAVHCILLFSELDIMYSRREAQTADKLKLIDLWLCLFLKLQLELCQSL